MHCRMFYFFSEQDTNYETQCTKEFTLDAELAVPERFRLDSVHELSCEGVVC